MEIEHQNLATITNISILGSIGFIASSLLYSINDSIGDLSISKGGYLVGGILILLFAGIEFFRMRNRQTLSDKGDFLLLMGIVSYFVASIFLLIEVIL